MNAQTLAERVEGLTSPDAELDTELTALFLRLGKWPEARPDADVKLVVQMASGAWTGTKRYTRDPAAILADRVPADPTDAAVSTRPRDDPFIYFVQVGAYGRPEDAEQQRAKLAMMGLEARITERDQSGRTVYRVRLGPFDKRDSADAAKERVEASAVEAALVRVQK